MARQKQAGQPARLRVAAHEGGCSYELLMSFECWGAVNGRDQGRAGLG